MAEDLSDYLNIIRTESSRLNQAGDRLGTAVRGLNERLAEMNVCIVCYYTEEFFDASTDYGSGDAQSCRYFIGYDREKSGTWGISVMCRSNILPDHIPSQAASIATVSDRGDGVRWVKPFDTCPRVVRISLARFIPKVLQGLAAALRNIGTDLDDTLRDIAALDVTK